VALQRSRGCTAATSFSSHDTPGDRHYRLRSTSEHGRATVPGLPRRHLRSRNSAHCLDPRAHCSFTTFLALPASLRHTGYKYSFETELPFGRVTPAGNIPESEGLQLSSAGRALSRSVPSPHHPLDGLGQHQLLSASLLAKTTGFMPSSFPVLNSASP
jgi:hypothetical protein